MYMEKQDEVDWENKWGGESDWLAWLYHEP
jgi:hypothetical protein